MDREYIRGRVSVITPVYNAEKHIEEAVNSALNQTYSDIEIVLVDDCSNDDSAKIITELKEKHKNIIYFLQPRNLGAGAARNKALELASGQYVAFLDSDDIWLPQKTDEQIKLMLKCGSPFSYSAIEMIDEAGDRIKGKREIREQCDYNYLLHNTIIATSSVIVDRTILGDFRMSLRRGGQDYATWLKLLRNGVNACGINSTLVEYRVSSGSLSSNKFKSIKQVWEIQTQEEKINKGKAIFNVLCFIINALKKYLL